MDPQYAENGKDWIRDIVTQAIHDRASDIHFEPEVEGIHVRFRIDGLLTLHTVLPKYTQENFISRIKISAGMDITDHRLPQDGHFEFNTEKKYYTIRVSLLPTVHGETIVFRILNRDDVYIQLPKLGFEPDQLEQVNQLIASPSGMVLSTGPVGSGKTNLLYSIIDKLNHSDTNIITLEDPIEYLIPGIRQVQISEGVGLTFSKALRSVVRQDPDIVMVGEIRDSDTAQFAIQTSLVGMLILSTFHTFDMPALVSRLMEMGVSHSLIAQSMQGIISSRLVRKICESCKTTHTPTDVEKNILTDNLPTTITKGKGCSACKNTGYLGRIGIFEVVTFDDDIRTTIIEKKPASIMYSLLKSKRIKTLHDAAIQKVYKGVTTVEEIIRVLGYPKNGKTDSVYPR
jgi:type II secretory ATPase GspE/PulE/Tfp pilus assembly ATPase PilB-like protein